jgi:purine/pyrimidine-nucleoside phosphorylase
MKHNTYFEGRVQSLEVATASGRATVGVIEPGTYTFSTSSEEHIVVVEGTLKAKVPGAGWRSFAKGQEIVVPSGVSFDVEAAGDVAYICYYR